MYYIGRLPQNKIIVFEYGSKLTQKKRRKMAEHLLKFCREHYDISMEHQTIKRSLQTLEGYFDKYKTFERTERGYKTDNSTSLTNPEIKYISL